MDTAHGRRAALALALALTAGACAGTQDPRQAAVDYRGTTPGESPEPAARSDGAPAAAAGSGIRQRDGYVTATAREGDTVATVAQRVGIPAVDLGAYNGLGANQSLRAGDELVLPPRAEGYDRAQARPAPAPEPQAEIETRPLESEATALDASDPEATGEAATVAPGAGLVAESGTGWSPNLAAEAIDRATGLDGEGRLNAPPSAADPLPEDPESTPELTSPDLAQYQSPFTALPVAREEEAATAAAPEEGTAAPSPAVRPEPPAPQAEAAPAPEPQADPAPEPEPEPRVAARTPDPEPMPAPSGGRLLPPVDAPIALGFGPRPDGGRNEGIDFAAPAGAPVVAAADGEVALVSTALGGLGTIVLLRHADELLTVYGRLADVTVEKGDIVSRGQRIGSVARPEPPTEARMHFEIREGARAVDPAPYLGG